ncbi:RluA family pseudouridine synthase [Eubacterium oxidoreducens]|uniref:RNA pseudouridylate synthase n=1 Tax=Eubacterium oxidoreducens TaxID=1732 RepID=A0A1G6BWF9_EUBOX|nr:RNA pseudouridine synthase [Eubacterium oxidoreducens]SDB24944.1 23S rRNA pseudouridine1911/1915/1917 synthase [Eubacterium oxidoreducens]
MKTDILYEDDELIVCYKPAGLPTQTRQITQKDLVSELRNHLSKENGDSYVGVIHRLDQPVEGILVFAKNQKAAADLSKQVRERQIVKIYRAVVCGEVPDKGVLEDELVKDSKANKALVLAQPSGQSKHARLSYKRLYTNGEVSLVEITLETGRYHQIRAQFAHDGHPLVGDRKYGSVSVQGWEKMPLALCAIRLEFEHPTTKKSMEYTIAPKQEAFLKIEEMRK